MTGPTARRAHIDDLGRYVTTWGEFAHLTRRETRCRCGLCDEWEIAQDTVDLFAQLREATGGNPLNVLSARRCPHHNDAVGGALRSQHLMLNGKFSRALDVTSRILPPKVLARAAAHLLPDWGGIGQYVTFVHIDTRVDKARW